MPGRSAKMRRVNRATRLSNLVAVAGFMFLAGCASSPDARDDAASWASIPTAVARAEDVDVESPVPTPGTIPRSIPSGASESTDAEQKHAEAEDAVAGRGDTAHEESEYVLEFFFGYTTERADGGPTIGIDYSRHIARTWGMSAFAEVVALSSPAAVIGVGPHFRPTHKIVLVALPGIEFEGGGHREFLMRLGGKIDLWETGSIEFAPVFYVDLFLEDEAYIFGLNFGINF